MDNENEKPKTNFPSASNRENLTAKDGQPSNENNTPLVTNGPKRRLPLLGLNSGKLGKKRILIGVIAILVLLAAIVGSLLYQKNQETPAASAKVCSDTLIITASKAIEDNNLSELNKVQSEILKKDEYTKDPNCLFLLVRYNLLRNDAVSSRKYLDMLKEVYSPETGYSSVMGTQRLTPEDLEKIVVFIENREAQIQEQQKKDQAQWADMNQAADDFANGLRE